MQSQSKITGKIIIDGWIKLLIQILKFKSHNHQTVQ